MTDGAAAFELCLQATSIRQGDLCISLRHCRVHSLALQWWFTALPLWLIIQNVSFTCIGRSTEYKAQSPQTGKLNWSVEVIFRGKKGCFQKQGSQKVPSPKKQFHWKSGSCVWTAADTLKLTCCLAGLLAILVPGLFLLPAPEQTEIFQFTVDTSSLKCKVMPVQCTLVNCNGFKTFPTTHTREMIVFFYQPVTILGNKKSPKD